MIDPLEMLIERCKPELGSDLLMIGAWLSCIHWGLGDSDIRSRFEADTGQRWTAPTTPLDRLIDEATGRADGYVLAFAEWITANVWGCEGEVWKSGDAA